MQRRRPKGRRRISGDANVPEYVNVGDVWRGASRATSHDPIGNGRKGHDVVFIAPPGIYLNTWLPARDIPHEPGVAANELPPHPFWGRGHLYTPFPSRVGG